MTATNGGALPLTTTFIPPKECLNSLYAPWNTASAPRSFMNLGPANPLECLPRGWVSTSYFSPGICPSGYVIAAKSTAQAGSAVETRATCCPVGKGNTYSTRPSSSWTWPWYTSEICQWSPEPNMMTTYNFTYTAGGLLATTTGTMDDTGLINAYGVEIRWQATDFTTAPATASATTTADATKGSTQDSAGMSSGAKAGVGVGVAIGAILVFLAIGFFILRRRKNRAHDWPHDPYVSLPAQPGYSQKKVELPAAQPGGFAYQNSELGSRPIFEKGDTAKPYELAELEGSSTR